MTRSARRALTGLLGFALAATACSSERTAKETSTSPSPNAGMVSGPGAVMIHLVAFDPPRLEVAAGTTVTWTQTDKDAVHTATSGTVDVDATGATTVHADGTFDSGELTEGRHFSFTFPQPGTYPYFCVIHQATMRGEVRVR